MTDLKPPNYHFFVDNNKFETPHSSLNGQEIKNVAGVPPNYQLFLEEHGNAPDRAISDTDGIDLSTNPPKHFYAVPPATFGHA